MFLFEFSSYSLNYFEAETEKVANFTHDETKHRNSILPPMKS